MNVKGLKSYKLCSVLTMELNQIAMTKEIWEFHNSVKIKQYTLKLSVCQRRNYKENQKIFWDERKGSHNTPKLYWMQLKQCFRGKFTAVNIIWP